MSNRNTACAQDRRQLGPNIWVVRRGKRFSIKEEGDRHCLVSPISQWSAIRIAQILARANKSDVIVQSTSALIRFHDSHGNDPFPPGG